MIEVPITDAQFARAAERLRSSGIEIAGPSGTISRDGITARYQHAGGKFTVEILDKPFFLPLSLIESRLRAYLDQALAADASRSV